MLGSNPIPTSAPDDSPRSLNRNDREETQTPSRSEPVGQAHGRYCDRRELKTASRHRKNRARARQLLPEVRPAALRVAGRAPLVSHRSNGPKLHGLCPKRSLMSGVGRASERSMGASLSSVPDAVSIAADPVPLLARSWCTTAGSMHTKPSLFGQRAADGVVVGGKWASGAAELGRGSTCGCYKQTHWQDGLTKRGRRSQINREVLGCGQPKLHRRSQLANFFFELPRKLNRCLLSDRQRHCWDR